MSIAPTHATNSNRVTLRPQPVAMRPFPQPSAPPQPSGAPPSTGDSLDGVEAQFAASQTSLTSLIAQLSRQLASIERTFINALQTLARNVESNPAGTRSRAPSTHATQPQAVNPYDGLIRRSAQRHELDPALLTAVVRAESGFDSHALSKAGAMGLMQLMPPTAESLGVSNPYDPEQNVDAGARLLRGYIDQYHGRLDLALAAYNAGPGAVAKYGGVPPYAETRNYVSSILADYKATALSA